MHERNRMENRTGTLVMTALLAALTCAATMSVRIPTVGTGGYIHPGDAIVILCGVILGPAWGFAAAGIGSCLADFLGGYMIYVPITFVIKGLVAWTAGLIYRRIGKTVRTRYIAVFLGGVMDILLVVFGYFICEIPLYGFAAAAAGMPANLVQGLGGLIIAVILYPILFAVPEVKRMVHP